MPFRSAFYFLITLSVASCNLLDRISDAWTVSGDVVFQGVPSGPVKLACFYTYEYSFVTIQHSGTKIPDKC